MRPTLSMQQGHPERLPAAPTARAVVFRTHSTAEKHWNGAQGRAWPRRRAEWAGRCESNEAELQHADAALAGAAVLLPDLASVPIWLVCRGTGWGSELAFGK